jgi:hypothetical protein
MSEQQENQLDDKFYERADAHIALANGHINANIHPGVASNSLMFAGSRFNAWVAAAGFTNGEDMKKEKAEILDFFSTQYKLMLEENLDNYIDNFDNFMGVSKEEAEK